MKSFELVKTWEVEKVSIGVIKFGQKPKTTSLQKENFQLASVTKLFTTYTALIAIKDNVVGLEDEVGPCKGSTLAHLLSHSSGLAFDKNNCLMPLETRRIYSNIGFEYIGNYISQKVKLPFGIYMKEKFFDALGMDNSSLTGSPAAGAESNLEDLILFAQELFSPSLIPPTTLSLATKPIFPDLGGILPGFGKQEPNDWGLGFEIKGHKIPHWTAPSNSELTFGHFGRSGCFLWIDPKIKMSCIALTNRDFGPWAAQNWPVFNESIIRELTPNS